MGISSRNGQGYRQGVVILILAIAAAVFAVDYRTYHDDWAIIACAVTLLALIIFGIYANFGSAIRRLLTERRTT